LRFIIRCRLTLAELPQILSDFIFTLRLAAYPVPSRFLEFFLPTPPTKLKYAVMNADLI